MNYFESPAAAKRYARSRPYFHPIVEAAIRARLPEGFVFKRGLDVACGTGMSTRMLSGLARQVIGTDASQAMLGQAFTAPNIEYRIGSAEHLDFSDSQFDILTVALALHWLDRSTFLGEARRVLEPGGLMVLYNHGFTGEMSGNPAVQEWHKATYLTRYPKTWRDSRPLLEADAAAAGFTNFAIENFESYWPFTLDEFARYLTTQSLVIAAVEAGRETDDEARAWIVRELQPFWKFEHETFRFTGSITFLTNGKAA